MKVTVTEFKKTPTGTFTESYSGLVLPLPGVPSYSPEANELALGDFFKNAAGKLSPLKGGVVLGEIRETLKMLKRPASALRDGFTRYNNVVRHRISRVRGPRREKLRIVKDIITGTYLEFTFGWKPLLGDIEDAAKAYRALMKKSEVVHVQGLGMAKHALPGEQLHIVNHVGNFIDFVEDTKCVRSTNVKYVGAVDLKKSGYQDEASAEVIRLSGFNLNEFLPTLWELLPHSFIVDYFSNIGDILNSGYGLTSKWVYACRDVKDTVKITVQRRQRHLVLPGESGTVSYGENNAPGTISRSNFKRDNPPLRLPMLVVEMSNNVWHWINISALISQRIRL